MSQDLDQQHVLSDIKSSMKYKKYNIFKSLFWPEIAFYHLFYWIGTAYSLYRFHIYSKAWAKHFPLTPKNSALGHQDQNDLEWNVFLPILLEFTPYGLLHLLLSQVIKYFIPNLLLHFYIIFSSFVLLKILGSFGIVLCFFIPIIMFMVLMFRQKTLIWLTWCIILVIFNTERFSQFLIVWLGDIPDGEYKCSVIVAWMILRSLSFCLDSCEDKNSPTNTISQFFMLLSYSFYFPLVLTGPFMPYSSFQEGILKPVQSWDLKRISSLFFNLMRFSFWGLIADTSLYFFYGHSLQYSAKFASKMDSWTLAGFVYFLMVFFFLKYVVYYGLTAVYAKAEGFETPRHPRCVLLVFRFSDIWRHFDRGLYLFMRKHIYTSFVGNERYSTIKRLQGSVIVFTFVYIWHGASPVVFWWCLFNFLGLLLERMALNLAKQDIFLRFENNWLNDRRKRRLTAFLCSILLFVSAISLVIFLSSLENAVHVLRHSLVKGFPLTTFTTIFSFYCIAQCSIDLEKFRCKDIRPSTKLD